MIPNTTQLPTQETIDRFAEEVRSAFPQMQWRLSDLPNEVLMTAEILHTFKITVYREWRSGKYKAFVDRPGLQLWQSDTEVTTLEETIASLRQYLNTFADAIRIAATPSIEELLNEKP